MLMEKWAKDKAQRPSKPVTAAPRKAVAALDLGRNDLMILRPVKHPTPEEADKLMRDIRRIAAKNKRLGLKETGSSVLRKLRDGRLK